MVVRELQLDESGYRPGETLRHHGDEFTHITITYNVSGERHLVDRQIEEAIENDSHLIKIESVNTTLYWQLSLGDQDDSKSELINKARRLLKNKLKDIFVGESLLRDTTVSVFCMVGNLRAFAFEISK